MATMRTIITDFKAGELDPRLLMRTDAKAYNSGGSSMKNCLIRNAGSVSRRPGTFKKASLGAQTKLREFEFDEDEKYILAFQAEALKIYNADGTLVQTLTSQPWDNDQAADLTIAQAGDVCFIAHTAFQTRILTRTGLSTFTMELFTFDESPDGKNVYQPYIKFPAASVTLTPSATTGSITLTSSAALFDEDHVGTYFRIYGVEIEITAVTDSTHATGTCASDLKVQLDANPFAAVDGDDRIVVTHAFHGLSTGASITISGAPDHTDSGGATSIAKAALNTSHTITVIDEDHYYFDCGDNATTASDFGGTQVYVTTTAATRAWDEQVFSDVRGWPAAVAFHEDRLVFASTVEIPNGVWTSQTGKYKDFDVGEGEDDTSIQLTAAGSRIPNIRHVLSNRHLQIFSQGTEFVARAPQDEGLTPSNVTVKVQTPYGASSVAPKVFDGATLFVQASGKAVREYLYEAGQEAYTAVDVSTLSPHLIKQPVDLAVVYGTADRPEQYAFIVNTDGTMAVFHSIRSEGLAAWVPWEAFTGHSFRSVCVLGSKVFVVAQRHGSYWLEQVDFDSNTTLDGAVSLSAGAPTVNWSLGSDYANRTVHVVSNDYYLGEYEADGSGDIVLDAEVEEIVAGYDYELTIDPLPVEVLLADGPTTGSYKRINACIIHLKDTLNILIEGKRIATRQAGVEIDLSEPPTPLEGKYKQFFLGYQRDRKLSITQDEPLRLEILGMVLEVLV